MLQELMVIMLLYHADRIFAHFRYKAWMLTGSILGEYILERYTAGGPVNGCLVAMERITSKFQIQRKPGKSMRIRSSCQRSDLP